MPKSHYKSWIHLSNTWGKYITPPSRPCKTTLRIYDKAIKKLKIGEDRDIKALILGATPELRELCLENNFKVTVCDINPDMVKAMSSLIEKNSGQEKILITDWLKMSFPQNSFNLIMGDASFNQILEVKKLKKLLGNLRKILKPDGIILFREVIRISPKPLIKGEAWVRWFKKYLAGGISKMDLYSIYKYQSDTNKYSKSPDLIDWPPVLRKLERLELEGKIDGSFVKWCKKVLGDKSKPLLVFVEKDLKKFFNKYFKVSQIKQCRDNHFCKYFPIFLLKSNK